MLEHVESCQPDQVIEVTGVGVAYVSNGGNMVGLAGVLEAGDHPHMLDLLAILLQRPLIQADNLINIKQHQQPVVLPCLGWDLCSAEN